MSINEKMLVETLTSHQATFNIILEFLCNEVLTGSQSRKLNDALNDYSQEMLDREDLFPDITESTLDNDTIKQEDT